MASGKKKTVKAYDTGTLAFLAVLGIVLIALGVLSGLAIVGGLSGALFDQVKYAMQGLGGFLCLGVSVLLIWGGVLVAFSSGRSMPKRGILVATLLYLSVLAIVNLLSTVGVNSVVSSLMDGAVNYNNANYNPPLPNPDGYWNVITACYYMAADSGLSGGADPIAPKGVPGGRKRSLALPYGNVGAGRSRL